MQVPAQPAAIPFATGTAPPKSTRGAGPSSAAAGGITEVDELPLADVASVLSPFLASSLGIAPQSMRSFLRIDDLTFDLLSPLGEGRLGEPEQEKFGGKAPTLA
jgi:hypothetical protein